MASRSGVTTAVSGSSLSMERPASRGDRVRDALEQAILDGTLPPGTPLVEREVAALLGVSKTPVREALKQVEARGLVVSHSYQGMSVRSLDADSVRQLHEARLVLEPQALRLGAQVHGAVAHPAARRALKEAEMLLDSEHSADLARTNRRFHRELYVLCRNEWLISFLDKLQLLNAFVGTAGWRVEPTFTSEAEEHHAILAAVEVGDGTLAESLLRDHIVGAAQALMRELDDREDTP